MEYRIVTLPGDGIGPDIVKEAVKVLDKVAEVYGHTFTYDEKLMGGCAIDKVGSSLPQETIDACLKADAVLLGAVGGPKWDNLPNGDRPEKGLLGIRGALKLFANLRPAILYPQLKHATPLKEEIVGDGLDILIVRELTSGIYFGEKNKVVCEEDDSKTYASDLEKYTVAEIERIVRVGFNAAMKRGKKVCVVDKANVLESSRLWRVVVNRVAKDYPEVEYSFMYVDNAAMQLVVNPKQFDVIITSNIFGDILSDEASIITGSIGMLSSASLGEGSLGLYEPSHGSAPDIAGQNKANPLATILSAAMMLRYSLNLETEAKAIEEAVMKVLDAGYRTGDIMSEGMKQVGTVEMGNLVVNHIK
ncbi:MAG: 3-isopropylmalate dehydrogenase [Candidatus Cellulosilyticum pullistercoris]|uniref:3-isopropylmalate dehydrogenase n=1 Tax=Candidatus Cellulosilyticum pullistercoris TaxID=2838521 RepID=A0A9E2KC33_9FIRM|nr:3-isopropylmalate dehydrogenase [Candidatus Cellulosilyticum pullistercoris]